MLGVLSSTFSEGPIRQSSLKHEGRISVPTRWMPHPPRACAPKHLMKACGEQVLRSATQPKMRESFYSSYGSHRVEAPGRVDHAPGPPLRQLRRRH